MFVGKTKSGKAKRAPVPPRAKTEVRSRKAALYDDGTFSRDMDLALAASNRSHKAAEVARKDEADKAVAAAVAAELATVVVPASVRCPDGRLRSRVAAWFNGCGGLLRRGPVPPRSPDPSPGHSLDVTPGRFIASFGFKLILNPRRLNVVSVLAEGDLDTSAADSATASPSGLNASRL